MPKLQLPVPIINESAEQEIWRLMSKGFEPNRWRPDFEQWTQKRLWAENYQDRLLNTLERCAGPVAGKRVLDLGSGRGGLSVALGALGAKVVAVDLRQRNLRILRLRGGRYKMRINSARSVGEALPFRDRSFDLVICKDVTEHCRSPRELLSEIARVLAPGGKAYVTFINRFAWVDPHYRLRGINFLPRSLAELIISLRHRTKSNSRDLQRLSDMHYFSARAAARLAALCGLHYTDVGMPCHVDNVSLKTRLVDSIPLISCGVGTLESLLTKRSD